MTYTKNQHVLSQWILRNFRSDDTAESSRDKKRVWNHTVYFDPNKGNVIRDIPLPISSVGMKKNCFLFTDGVTGSKFDIENELSIYEGKTSKVFDKLIKEQNFQCLLDVNFHDCPLEIILNYCIIQSVLNLHNPQNEYEKKDELLSSLTEGLLNDFYNLKEQINHPPLELSEVFNNEIHKKIRRVVNASSSKEEICNALFVLFMIIESENLPTLTQFLSTKRNSLFEGIYIEAIYHTGYDFNSREPRPVFSIGPNIMCSDFENSSFYLPISHNFAIKFSIGKRKFYNDTLNIMSADYGKLKCRSLKNINVFRVSHDYIDNITSLININNLKNSKTIYTPHCVEDVKAYMSLQDEDKDFYYTPEKPELIMGLRAHA